MKPSSRRLLLTLLAVLGLALWQCSFAYGRAGGGHSYSGGGHSSGGHSSGGHSGGGSSGGDIFNLVVLLFRLVELNFEYPIVGFPIDLIIVGVIVWISYNQRQNQDVGNYSSQRAAAAETARRSAGLDEEIEGLRRHDPNFSPILFTDFAYALYARVQEARGRKDLTNYGPYLYAKVIEQLQQGAEDLKSITGVIVGAFRIQTVSDSTRPMISILVEFETNYTETQKNGTTTTWYNKENWTFLRKRDVLSRPPDKITAIHCPKCGGALEQNPDGTCKHCGVKVIGGDFDWYVSRIRILDHENRSPLLTSDVPEVGTDWPTIYQPDLAAKRQRFLALNPGFSWTQMQERIRHIFLEIQAAWSELKWDRARPYVSDSLFQMQMYWITEYKRQRLRNVLTDVRIDKIQPVKVALDAFHDALTFRIFVQMIDYTADEQGKVLSGDKNSPRSFSEYWTFIRRRGAKTPDKGNANCPNCGAALKVNMAGVCEYCQGKITNGDFDWVLSRIEQDESYSG
ncbi:MAG: Tim44 domain-containing protein [Gemmataceae bacterium]